jgi:hypothetical protein
MPQTSMFVLMMNIWKVLMAVCHRLMSVQVRVLTSWRRPIRMDMLMMLIMFVLMAMCRVPDDWLLKNKRPLLHGREVLQAVLATWQSRAKELPC